MMLPDTFCKRTRALLGDERWSVMENALSEEPTVSVRCNPWKSAGWQSERWQTDGAVPWCAEGFYLKTRPSFTFDPFLHAGVYYVQEASSMFVSHAVRELVKMWDEERGMLVLDMCAAPGGKSTAMLGALPKDSMLFSNEPLRLRANILAENLSKYGHPNVVVTNNYPNDYERSGLLFDLILCDVPCSGEGMFRKDAGAIEEWSEEHVRQCSQLQREIVNSAWKVLRPGGFLIYSTCTFNREENEDNVRWMVDELRATPWLIDYDRNWGIQGSMTEEYAGPCYRFLPGFTRGEGLFMSVVRKLPLENTERGQKKNIPLPPSKRKGSNLQKGKKAIEWIEGNEGYEVLNKGDMVYGVSRRWLSEVEKGMMHLRVLQAGVTLGAQKGKDLLPDVRLALSTVLCHDAFPQVALDYEQAMAYLHREALVLHDTPRGVVLVSYQGFPLGFVKNVGNRANNLYPAEWRVRKRE